MIYYNDELEIFNKIKREMSALTIQENANKLPSYLYELRLLIKTLYMKWDNDDQEIIKLIDEIQIFIYQMKSLYLYL